MLREATLVEFSEALASEQPAPGGGSASAAVGAMGASLLVMTCNLTIGREKYAEVEGELLEIRDELEPIRVWLLASVDRDSEAYDAVSAAFRMPKGAPEEKAARRDAIQVALRKASEVPMDVARRCVRGLELATVVARSGNPNALSDAGCGAQFLASGLHGALYNVRINLGSIKDEAFVAEMTAEAHRLEDRARTALSEVTSIVDGGL
jgi:formiminotetrahydrofolate cyclodeaminase